MGLPAVMGLVVEEMIERRRASGCGHITGLTMFVAERVEIRISAIRSWLIGHLCLGIRQLALAADRGAWQARRPPGERYIHIRSPTRRFLCRARLKKARVSDSGFRRVRGRCIETRVARIVSANIQRSVMGLRRQRRGNRTRRSQCIPQKRRDSLSAAVHRCASTCSTMGRRRHAQSMPEHGVVLRDPTARNQA